MEALQYPRYKLKLNGDYIEGEGLDNNPRLSFEISVDDLYDAYKDGADTTVKLKGYKSLRWKQSPSLAILDKVRSGSVGLRGRLLMQDDGRGNGVVLNSGGNKIVTGLSSEEILEQLDLDYQDVYDYYGGADNADDMIFVIA